VKSVLTIPRNAQTEKASDMTTVAQQREQSNFIDVVQAFLPPDKLQRKRSLAIKRLAEASAALDAHLKTWTPDFYDNFINSDQVSILAGRSCVLLLGRSIPAISPSSS
jgi:hypothetical protein